MSEHDVAEGIALAEARFHDVVHEPVISGLGPNDIKYLWRCARTNDSPNHPRLLGAWVKRPMRSPPIRAKLLQREVIQAPQRGYVQFAGPRYLAARECRRNSRTVLGRVVIRF